MVGVGRLDTDSGCAVQPHGAGLPIGMLLTAGAGREGLLLRLASQMETAAPWPLLTHTHGPDQAGTPPGSAAW